MSVDKIALIIALVLMGVAVLLGFLLVREIRHQHPRLIRRRRRRFTFPALFPPSNPELLQLQQRLTGMLCGDRETAHRMVNYERYQNQGRTEAWYWQAAIDRLIRDRR